MPCPTRLKRNFFHVLEGFLVPESAPRARLAEIMRDRSFGRGEITLASGRKSDFYFNLKPTMLDAEGAALLAELTFEALRDERVDYVGGLEMGAVGSEEDTT